MGNNKRNYGVVPTGTTVIRGEAAVKAATVTTGKIEYSPYSVFPEGTIVRVAPLDSESFGFTEHITFKVGSREYTEQRGLYVFLDNEETPRPVHFTGCFRNRPTVSNSGDDDFLQQLLEKKITFIKKGFTAEGVRTYAENPVKCTEFDDKQGINYLRMSRTTTDWEVIEKLAGKAWKVDHMVIAESRAFRKGLPPRQIYMNIPILVELGPWNME